MYVRIVTFRLHSLTADAYQAHAVEIADQFNSWPGLRSKVWLADREADTYGGVYLFDTREAADCSRETDLFQLMRQSPYFTDLRIEEFEVLDAPTAVTRGSIAVSDRVSA